MNIIMYSYIRFVSLDIIYAVVLIDNLGIPYSLLLLLLGSSNQLPIKDNMLDLKSIQQFLG